MGHRISREERFKKQDKYAYIMNESNPQKPVEKTEGPRKIAIRMYKEGKTLAQISSELPRNFSKENIITWLMDEFPNNEIRKYWMADKAKDIIVSLKKIFIHFPPKIKKYTFINYIYKSVFYSFNI